MNIYEAVTNEIIKELTDAYLSAIAVIAQITIEDSSIYVRGLMKVMKVDKKLLILAAAQTQKVFGTLFTTK